jgi:hypothetical protein
VRYTALGSPFIKKRYGNLNGCEIIAGGRRPLESYRWLFRTLKGCRILEIIGLPYRRSALRSDLRLLPGNPAGCKK